jgi:5-methyltetrahydrofolate--homocysteine methyltransferase
MGIRDQLNFIAEKRIIILDGAMGSVVQVLNLDEKSYRGSLFPDHPTPLEGCNDLLCLTRPGAIGAIHDTYLEAGADIIETCSFNSTSISLSDYGLGYLSYEISEAAAKIARNSADKFSVHGKPRFVAGSLGPTSKGASLYPDINDPSKRSICWDDLEAAYYDSARGLLDGGADILLVETVFDTLNAKAALFAISRLLEERQIDVPVMISASISNESGRLLAGQNLEAFLVSVLHIKPWSIGLNCSFHAQKLLPNVRLLSEISPCLVSAYPNAGLPNKYGRYEETPDIMSAEIEPYLEEGLINIIGGCCGSTPAHIAAIAEIARNCPPRKITDIPRLSSFSGLEALHIENNTVNIKNTENSGEREEFLKSLADGEYEDAADTATNMIENGCEILNVEIDDEKSMNGFLDYALMNPYLTKAPFMINSLKMTVLKAGLKRLQGRGLAGPVNLKDGEEEFLSRAQTVRRYGAAVLVTLVDEQGQGETFERKTEIARRIYELLKKNGYPPENIVIGPLSGEDDSVCSWIRDNCPDVLIAV